VPTVENIELVHARFPCFSPDFHLYGYRFRVHAKKSEWSYGDICWNVATRQWSWVTLPRYELSHLTPATHWTSRRGAVITGKNQIMILPTRVVRAGCRGGALKLCPRGMTKRLSSASTVIG
jgi:hypothetical protein